MSGNTTSNSSALTRQQVYLDTAILPLLEPLLNNDFVQDLSGFSDGDLANVPIIGEAPIHDYQENDDPKFSAFSLSRFQMSITEYKESAAYVTKKQIQDGYATRLLTSQIIPQQRQAIMDAYETHILGTQDAQTAGNANVINTAPHRFFASGASNVIALEDFANAAYAMDMANIPLEDRVAIIDPFSALQLNKITNIINVSNNPTFQGIINKGFRSGAHDFSASIYNFKVIVSNRLAVIPTETIGGSTVTNTRACLFMSLANDQCKPFARAWRQMPQAYFNDNEHKRREEYWMDARWGRGLIRPDGLVTVLAKVPTSGVSI